ncbi:hypothetical protein BJV78DRAFT_546061 [Lactifluus subvellereus]|nr:hypothetical protein BJV78DRAFT_546061 [Lactifluus subvellereus]
MMARRSSYQIRPPPKEVFPESTLSPGGLQLTTLFWDMGILFHQGSHAGARVGNNFEVFGCITTHVSNKSNAPPHPIYWRRIPSPGGSFSLSGPITAFASTTYQGGAHRIHGRHHPFARNHPSHAPPPPHLTAGASNEYFPQGRAHVPIKHDNDQLASSENALRHASEAGLGPVQNGTAPGLSIDRPTGYHCGAEPLSAPMGNSAPQGHDRVPQFQNPTTQPTGHDRTGVGGGRKDNIDTSEMLGSVPLPAGQPLVQPIS